MLPKLDRVLSRISGTLSAGPLLDIGCGHGGVATHVGQRLRIDDLYGIELDPEAVAGATARGVKAQRWNLQSTPLPYPDGMFAVVTSFGVLNYLPTYDDVVKEMFRLLMPGGHAILSLPNLASWHKRWMLLRGYQPRDLEISSRITVGLHPHYGSPPPVGHISGVTTTGFQDLMEYSGFERVSVSGASPAARVGRVNPAALVDRFCGWHANLARRFIYVGRRPLSGAPDGNRRNTAVGWWQQTGGTGSVSSS